MNWRNSKLSRKESFFSISKRKKEWSFPVHCVDLAAAPSSSHSIAVLITVKSGAEPESYSTSGRRSGSGGSRSGSYTRTAPQYVFTPLWYIHYRYWSRVDDVSSGVAAWSVAEGKLISLTTLRI